MNLRPSAIRTLGLHYDALRRYNPKIVCVALTGYGLDGPAAEWPSFDYVVQARTGVATMTGEPGGPPTLAGYSAVDNSAGIMAALGLVAKVLEGTGGQVDVSLLDVMLSQLNYKGAAYLNGGERPGRSRLGAHTFYVPAQLFETSSGYLALFVTRDEHWRRLCEEVGRPEWADDRALPPCEPASTTARSCCAPSGRSSRRPPPPSGRPASVRSRSRWAKFRSFPTPSTATWCVAGGWWCRWRPTRGRSS